MSGIRHTPLLASLQRLCGRAPHLVCLVGSDAIAWSNDAWSQLGYADTFLVDARVEAFMHEADAPMLRSWLGTVREAGAHDGLQVRMLTTDGDIRWMHVGGHVVDDGAVLMTAYDITSDVLREQRLLRERRLLEQAEAVAHTGHWFMEPGSDAVYWSPEVFRIHGLPAGSPQPSLQQALDAYHPNDRERVRERVSRAIADQLPFEFELRIVRPSGEVRTVQSLGRPVVDPKTGTVSAVLGVFRDVTDDERSHRLTQMELFAHMAAHDLRQPIRQISASLRRLGGQLELGSEDEVLWGIATRAASRLDDLVAELMTYVSAERSVACAPVALDTVVRSLAADLVPEFAAVGGRLLVEQALPDVEGTPAMLRQVFLNLFLNAIRYRDPSRVLEVAVTVSRRDGLVVVQVSDNGIGFEPEQAGRIFEPFRRLSHAQEGAGLGLSIVRRLLTQMGGGISADGKPGSGATFEVSLRPSE